MVGKYCNEKVLSQKKTGERRLSTIETDTALVAVTRKEFDSVGAGTALVAGTGKRGDERALSRLLRSLLRNSARNLGSAYCTLTLSTEGQQEQQFHLPEAEPKASRTKFLHEAEPEVGKTEFLALKLSPAHAARVNPVLGDQPML